MSGRTTACAARLSRKDLALMRSAERSPTGWIEIYESDRKRAARLSPLFLGVHAGRAAQITAYGKRVLADKLLAAIGAPR